MLCVRDDVMYCDVMYCDVVFCDVLWCAVLWCTVLWCTVMCCSVMCYDVLRCSVSRGRVGYVPVSEHVPQIPGLTDVREIFIPGILTCRHVDMWLNQVTADRGRWQGGHVTSSCSHLTAAHLTISYVSRWWQHVTVSQRLEIRNKRKNSCFSRWSVPPR